MSRVALLRGQRGSSGPRRLKPSYGRAAEGALGAVPTASPAAREAVGRLPLADRAHHLERLVEARHREHPQTVGYVTDDFGAVGLGGEEPVGPGILRPEHLLADAADRPDVAVGVDRAGARDVLAAREGARRERVV